MGCDMGTSLGMVAGLSYGVGQAKDKDKDKDKEGSHG
jgi:hypothetical protein